MYVMIYDGYDYAVNGDLGSDSYNDVISLLLGIHNLIDKLDQQSQELNRLKKHYDSIEQSNDNAYVALQITEIEAKNELHRLAQDYQIKHQREIDELKHVILQTEEDKQVLEASVAYNKTKYIQAQVCVVLMTVWLHLWSYV